MSRPPRSLVALVPLLFCTASAAAAVSPPPSPLFIETWENASDATTLWSVHTGNSSDPDTGGIDIVSGESVPCSTNYQHETIRASSGRAFTSMPQNGANITLSGASAYCVTAWIRGSTSPAAAPFLLIADESSATSASPKAANLIIGPTTPSGPGENRTVTVNGQWQWYKANYTSAGSAGDTVYINIADELWFDMSAAGSSADFDDIAIWPGDCSTVPTPTNHATCGTGTSCDTTQTDATYGTCVQCVDNSGCTGTPGTPICSNNVCVNCAANSDCTSDALPFCSSNVCSACNDSSQCSTHSPNLVCDTDSSQAALGSCVACAANGDCTSTQPACSTTTNTCGNCTKLSDCSLYAGTVCNVASGACVQCAGDGDCGGAGSVCDPGTNTCVPGCRGGLAPTGCPTGQFCTSETAAIGMCSTTCDFDNQCPSGQFCAGGGVDAGPTNCVQCRTSTDCSANVGHTVCAPGTFVCVECTSGSAGACSAAGNGAACLANQTCGCIADADCGGSTSGRICNSATNLCVVGCRGTGGNGCPTTMLCSSTNGSPGTCGPIPDTDMAMAEGADMTRLPVADMTMPEGADMTAVPVVGDMSQLPPVGTPDMSSTNHLGGGGGGCSCDVSGNGNLGDAWLLFAVGFMLVLRRRRARARL